MPGNSESPPMFMARRRASTSGLSLDGMTSRKYAPSSSFVPCTFRRDLRARAKKPRTSPAVRSAGRTWRCESDCGFPGFGRVKHWFDTLKLRVRAPSHRSIYSARVRCIHHAIFVGARYRSSSSSSDARRCSIRARINATSPSVSGARKRSA